MGPLSSDLGQCDAHAIGSWSAVCVRVSPASFLLRVTDPPSIAHCARHLRVQTASHQGTSREPTGFAFGRLGYA
ncbi:hypothetical protein M404DRAFT_1003683 [Pisolithus tinctorius Marx 270]|uniref:Uncharacterized protein n=1 Tax=Pisolithus tinctorius Marx 270 TaxID=870435 RepID=A0A0C3NI34_PISTI|nr:hypothetical protein M404DRAFT_1003683 [Pisolithus tinctorius Marx 270]